MMASGLEMTVRCEQPYGVNETLCSATDPLAPDAYGKSKEVSFAVWNALARTRLTKVEIPVPEFDVGPALPNTNLFMKRDAS